MTTTEIPAQSLTTGSITIDGFTVEYAPKVDSFGGVAARGITQRGVVETRVWAAGDLVPVRA